MGKASGQGSCRTHPFPHLPRAIPCRWKEHKSAQDPAQESLPGCGGAGPAYSLGCFESLQDRRVHCYWRASSVTIWAHPRPATSPPAQTLCPQILPRTRWDHPRMVPGRPVPRSHPCCFSDRSAAASPEDPLSSPGVCQQLFLLPLQQRLSSPSPRRKQDGPLG